jgi:hypothetical protein
MWEWGGAMLLRIGHFLGLFIIAGMLAVLFIYVSRALPFRSISTSTHQSIPTAIARENALPGTLNWQIPLHYAATTQIQAYADKTSVSAGEPITFYVSTQVPGTHYLLDIYRLGWYGGLGGRLMLRVTGLSGQAQGYYDPIAHQLIDCLSCHRELATGLLEAGWQPSYTLTIPTGWLSGVYVAKFIDAHALQTYAIFDLKSLQPSTYVVVTSELTFQAYNAWGGYSLYDADGSQSQKLEEVALQRAVKVSFDRPYLENHGSGQIFITEINAIRWLERQGYDLTYISGIDLHEEPDQLLAHRAYIDLGHDEYWTKEMRDGLENARDHGIGLAFLGANTGYWQVRLEPDSQQQKDRTIVCYRVSSYQHTLKLDPFYNKDNSRLTAKWADPILHRPENALVGVMYDSLTHTAEGFAWQIDPYANKQLLAGTGLQPEHTYGCGLVGYEWDEVIDNGVSPAGLRILASSPTTNYLGEPGASNSSYYIAPSGAFVFATGSIYWAHALDDYRYLSDPHCPAGQALVPGMQKLLSKILAELPVHREITN